MGNMFHASRWAEVSNYYLLTWQHLRLQEAQKKNLDLVEHIIIGNARRMDVMSGAKKKSFRYFTH